MIIGVPKETQSGENRVALVPETAAKLVKAGFEVRMERGAGEKAFFPDADYEKAGAKIAALDEVFASDIVAKVAVPSPAEIARLKSGSVYVSFLNPLAEPALTASLAKQGVTAFSMELIPRTSRAQSMDALSSQANIGGYKAVLTAAVAIGKYLPMLTTAAGTVPPAKVLVIGVGVAGLQAIATARRLGAVVSAYDIRPEVKEQVQSLGAKFVEAKIDVDARADGGYAKEVNEETKRKLQEALAESVAASDIVITTAQVPGKKAPVLVTRAMLERMRPGSVVVDMAAEQGGNVEGSKPGQTVQLNGVSLVGPVNLPSSMPLHASQLYSRNLFSLLGLLVKEGKLNLDFNDDILKGACASHAGQVVNDRVKGLLAS
ncbi:MAG: Re/Si-specific NAD(P)(+) transhydrogenase subunit alpha [Candidatus Omnitrophica bacterium]|nr:Re/Si-specific NAD(P)(+) transhydrogenase subunit alpha [Candidatus Omnitrophota bacterium]